MTKRTHVVLSDQLVKEIDELVGSRQRSSFITEAAQRELTRRRQLDALKAAAGAWADADHPELAAGSSQWVQASRKESDRRARKASAV